MLAIEPESIVGTRHRTLAKEAPGGRHCCQVQLLDIVLFTGACQLGVPLQAWNVWLCDAVFRDCGKESSEPD